jgi:autotransporter-associated beta strand protein
MRFFNWPRWLRSFLRARPQTVRRPKPGRRPLLEELEARLAPATFTWTGGGANTNWSTPANWSGGVAPAGAGDDLVFPTTSASSKSVNDLSNAVLNSITLSGGGYTLSGNAVKLGAPSVAGGSVIVASGASGETLALDVQLAGASGSHQFFTVNAGGDLTLTGKLSGTSGSELTKEGTGTLTLAADNSGFTGAITIDHDAGVVIITNANALGATSAGTTVGQNSQLQIKNVGSAINEALTLNGPGATNDGALLDATGNATWAGAVTLDADTTFGTAAGTTLTITGQVSDLGAGHNLTKEGAGTLYLDPLGVTAGNTYRGTTTINAGVLAIGHPFALGAGGTAASGTVVNATNNKSGALALKFTNDPNLKIDAQYLLTDSGGNAIGFKVPSEVLTLNGFGAAGLSVAPRSTGTRSTGPAPTADVAGALENLAGQNAWEPGINLWSGTANVLNNSGFYEAAVCIGAASGTQLTIDGTLQDNNVGQSKRYSLSKVGLGRLVFTTANAFTADVDVLQGYLNIRDSGALSQSSTRNVEVWSGTGLELEADGTADSATSVRDGSGNIITPSYNLSLPAVGTLRLNGTGVNNDGALHNIAGVNNVENNVSLQANSIITVEADPDPAGTRGQPWNQLSQLTMDGVIDGTINSVGINLTKSGGGELVLTAANIYTGLTFINQGWVTLRNNDALGVFVPGLGDTVQPGTTVASGAALVLKQALDGSALTVHENLTLAGTGITHRFAWLNQQGALLNLGGRNTVTGNITLQGSTGIGVERDGSVLASPASELTLFGTQGESGGAGSLDKLGSQRLILQGESTFTGDVDIQAGVLRIQNDAALGLGGGKAIVETGTALELGLTVPALTGGNLRGLQVANEHLVLNGTGNTAIGDGSLVIATADQMWRGPITLAGSTTFSVPTGARFDVFGVIDDQTNAAVTGSDITLSGGGELTLLGANTYRGTTFVKQGVLTVANSQGLGTAAGGTVVSDGAALELQGSITIAGEPLVVQGQGVASTPNVPLQWFAVGPAPISGGQTAGAMNVAGRVTGIAVDPTDPNVIYISTAGGGAWKTINGGLTWTPLFDSQNNSVLFGGAIAVAPSDPRILYYGTGEADNSIDSYYGSGVYKSTDSGKTWSLVADPTNPLNGLTVSKIAVDPNDPNVIYAATGDLAVNGKSGNVGIWRFDGTSWFNLTSVTSTARATVKSTQTNLPPVNPPNTPGPDDDYFAAFPQTAATWSDLSLIYTTAPGSSGKVPILFAALGTGMPTPGNSNRGNANDAVFRCMNPGSASATKPPVWYVGDPGNPVTADNRNSNEFPSNFGGTSPRNGVIKIAVVASGSLGTTTVYAAITDPSSSSPQLKEILKSTDGGASWSAVTSPGNYMDNRGFYATTIAASGTTVYVGGVESSAATHKSQVFQSTDGGSSWSDVSVDAVGNGPHSDHHAMAIDSKGRLVDGNDGGVWRLDSGKWNDLNGDLDITAFNGVTVSPTDPTMAFGGAVNNGELKFTGTSSWAEVDPGDGGQTHLDPNNPTIVYHDQNGTLVRSTSGGSAGSWTTLLTVKPNNNTWSTSPHFPFAVDTVNSSRLVVGSASVMESTDGGATWSNLGSAIAGATALGLATYQGTFSADSGFNATDKGANTYDPDTIYVASGGAVEVTKDHGQTWIRRTSGLPTGLDVRSIVVDPRNRDTAYLVNAGSSGGRVFVTNDAGQTWSDITGDLPGLPTWVIVLDPRSGALYVGNDEGVYASTNGGGHWQRFGVGLPNVQVTDLVLNQTLDTLTAATHGRGLYQFILADVSANGGALRAASGQSVWTGPVQLAGPTTIAAAGVQDLQSGASAASLTLLGTVSDQTPGGNFRLTKTGQGDVILAGSNTYGGVTEIQQGVLVVHNAQALGASTNGTVVDSGTALELQSNLDLEPLTLNGDGISFNGHNTGALHNISNNNVYTGTLTLNSDSTIGVDSGSSLTIQGTGTVTDSGTHSLTKELTGTLVLGSADSYHGNTLVNQGVLNVRDANALGVGGATTTVIDGAQLQIQGGVTVASEALRLSGTGVFGTGSLEGVGGTNTWQGTITLATDAGFSPVTTPPSAIAIGVLPTGALDRLTLSGAIGQAAGTLGLTKVGGGLLVLNDTNTFAGTTTVAAGELRIQKPGALGTPAGGTAVAAGAALGLDLDPTATGTAVTVSGEALTLNGAGVTGAEAGSLRNVSGNNTWAGFVTLATNAAIGADTGTQLTVTGNIQDPATAPVPASSLTKVGPGTVVLPNANTYTGETVVNGGILNVRNTSALGGNASEVQSVTLTGATTGSFTLTFNGQTTGSLSATSTPAQVKAALEGLSTIGGAGGTVTVSLSGSVYTITFGGALASTNLPQMTAAGSAAAVATVVTVADGAGGTTVNTGGTLQVQGSGLVFSGEALTLKGLGFNGLGALAATGGNNTWARTVALGDNASVGADSGLTLTISQAIGDGGKGFGLTKVGAGTVQFAGGLKTDNTYTGTTTVNQGTLELSKSAAAIGVAGGLAVGDGQPGAATARFLASGQLVSTAAVSVFSDGTFDLNGQSQTIGSLAMNGGQVTLTGAAARLILGGDVTATGGATIGGAGTLSLGGATRTITVTKGSSAPELTVSAVIAGTGATDGLNKDGTGTLSLTAHNTFTGSTTVKAGTLLADASAAAKTVDAVNASGGTIGGTGSVGAIASAAGTVAPGDSSTTLGTLSSDSVTLDSGSTFFVSLNSTAAGQFDQLAVQGDIDLAGAALDGSVGLLVGIGDSFTIITATGTVKHHFAEPFGAGIAFLGGEKFTVDYSDLSKVVLQRVKNSATVALASSDNPSPFGEDAQITATVKPEPGAASVPATDTVTFTVDGTAQETVTIGSGGKATFSPQALVGHVLSLGPHTIDAYFNGDGDFNAADATTLTQNVTQAVTATAVITDTAAPVFGQTVTLTAAVAPVAPGAGVPTGSVTFTIDGTAQAPIGLDGTGKAQLPLSSLGVGAHHVQAAYGGDTNDQPSSSTFDFTVNKATGAVTVAASGLTSSVFSQSVTFTATAAPVAPGIATPTGLVTFFDGPVGGGTALVTKALDSGGVATLQLSSLAAGTHTISASYAGDAHVTTAMGALDFTVNQATTATALTSSANPGTFGDAIVYSASVTAATPATATPSGTVTFVIDGVSQTPVALTTQGKAMLIRSSLPAGAHTIQANYDGTTNFAGSNSATVNETILNASTVVVTSNANPSVFGQSVTFNATVAAKAPATGIPPGQVAFVIDGVTQPAVNINTAGKAILSLSNLGTGPHTVAANYLGSTTFAASGSTTISQKVNKAGATVTITSTGPATFGQAVTFTATATAVAPGAGTPSGLVQFVIDGVARTPVALDGSGKATLAVSDFGAGTHTAGLNYFGDSNFNAFSTPTMFNQSVAIAPTKVTVTAPGTSVVGEPVTLTTIAVTLPPGAGTPSGFVQFVIDGVAQTPVALDAGGKATLTVSTFHSGTHTAGLNYFGTANFAAYSTPTLITQAVSAAATGVTVAAADTVFGQPENYVATVTAQSPSQGVPTGTVQILIDGTPQAPVALDASGKATLTLNPVAVMTHAISANFVGNADFKASATAGFVNETVSRAATSTTVTTPAATSALGQTVTFTAAVSPVAPSVLPVSGAVTFNVDGTGQPEVALDATGKATLTLGNLTLGKHTVSASFAANGSYTASASATLTQNVLFADTVTVGSSGSAVFGQPVTFTATATGVAPATGTPSGSVQFVIDGVAQAPVALTSSGKATVTVSNFNAGTHTVGANYFGDSQFAPFSTPTLFAQKVDPATTQVPVGSTGPTTFGQAVTFTAAAVTVAPGAGTPTGFVQFVIDGVAQTPVQLDADGKASIGVSGLSAGTHTAGLNYFGSASFAAFSTPTMFSQTVDQATTATTGTLSAATITVGQSITFSATVVSTSAGAGVPTGRVTFVVDGVAHGTATLDSKGIATITVSDLAAGNHAVLPVYLGDTNYHFSFPSSSLALTVNDVPHLASLSLAVSPASGVGTGSTFTLTATALDGTGNVLTTQSGSATVSLDSAPAQGTLSGTPTEAFSSGVATFGDLSVNRAGTYVIRVTLGNVTATISITAAGRSV